MAAATTRLKLVGATGFRTFRNVWMLEELGVSYEHITAGPRSAEASEGSPFGKVPWLADGEFVLYESAAINTYLGDKFRGHPSSSSSSSSFESGAAAADLVPPAGTQARGLYDQATICIMAELDAQALWIHRKHEALGRIFGACPQAVATAKAQSSRTVAVLASELRQRGGAFLLGAHFSAADILFVHCLNWAETIGWGEAWTSALQEDDEVMQGLARYLARCRGRPAYERTKAKQAAESRGA
jgi:glutathione S-transferase